MCLQHEPEKLFVGAVEDSRNRETRAVPSAEEDPLLSTKCTRALVIPSQTTPLPPLRPPQGAKLL